jgi:sulfite dehydrogenase
MPATRRGFLIAGAASLAGVALAGSAAIPGRSAPKVVVIGAGFGGAIAAKYIRQWSDGRIDVVLVEREAQFVSCPLSNLVIAGSRGLGDITISYDGLARWGIPAHPRRSGRDRCERPPGQSSLAAH